jgi:hydrogenase nickel incorporation protein HypA/HybF
MHEYSVARSLMDAIDATASENRATSVQRVHLRIGELAGIEVDLLRSAFGLVRERTICSEAELEVEISPAEWQCSFCGQSIPRGTALRCSDCDVPARMISGDEIMLERLEMEVS